MGENDWYTKDTNTGPGGTEWRLQQPDATCRLKYNKGVNTLSVILSFGGKFKNVGVVQYQKCEILAHASSKSSNTNVTASQRTFSAMSLCNRKYVQQFLKGQGLYSGGIDGLRGGGTLTGFDKAGKKGKLKGLTSSEIIKKVI